MRHSWSRFLGGLEIAEVWSCPCAYSKGTGSSRRSGSEGTRAEPLMILSAVAAQAPMCWRVARPEAWHHHSMVVKLDSLGEVSSLCLPGVKTTNRSSSYPPVSNRLGSSTRQQCGFSQGCIELWSASVVAFDRANSLLCLRIL